MHILLKSINDLLNNVLSPLCSGLEGILRFHPELINQPKDDGYTPLHIAAVNNFADLVSLIASHVSKSYIVKA